MPRWYAKYFILSNGQIFRLDHMFLGKDNPDQLVKISNVLGTKDLFKYLERLKMKLDAREFANLVP